MAAIITHATMIERFPLFTVRVRLPSGLPTWVKVREFNTVDQLKAQIWWQTAVLQDNFALAFGGWVLLGGQRLSQYDIKHDTDIVMDSPDMIGQYLVWPCGFAGCLGSDIAGVD